MKPSGSPYLRMNQLLCLLVSFFVAFFAEAAPPVSPRVVFMIGEDEYKTRETLPEFGKSDLEPKGFHVTVIHADKADSNSFPGLVEALRDADALLVSVRRRTPPKEQLDAVRAFVEAGKPLIGIRTACHAFALRKPADSPPPPLSTWNSFDPDVLGGNYTGHYKAGPKTSVSLTAEAAKNPLLDGVDVAHLEGNGTLYQVSPVKEACTVLLLGTIPGQSPEPVAWSRLHGAKQARIFYTSLGHPDDFKEQSFRRLLLNAILWAVQKPTR
jgi:type 1 glutamine amidotransferase